MIISLPTLPSLLRKPVFVVAVALLSSWISVGGAIGQPPPAIPAIEQEALRRINELRPRDASTQDAAGIADPAEVNGAPHPITLPGGFSNEPLPAEEVEVERPQDSAPLRQAGPRDAEARIEPPVWLGISAYQLAPAEREAFGATEAGTIVTGVFPGAAADKAGIQAGDVIVEAAGQPTPSTAELLAAIKNQFAGDDVTLIVSRRGRRSRITVPLSAAPENKNVELFELAQAGLPWAQFSIAQNYSSGTGTKQDFAKAKYWYEKAADAGIAQARMFLGTMYFKGQGIEVDLKRALALYEQVANQGDSGAQSKVATMYFRGQGAPINYETAARWFQEAALQGHAESQFQLARMAAAGQGIAKDDQTAFGLLTRAAEAGHVQAMGDLGHMYAAGTGVGVDYAMAVRWLTPAAEAGVALAQHDLGALYYYGRGVERNFGTAAEWFEAAGNQGFHASQVVLGDMYQATDPPDQEKSRYWREKAAAGGNAQAIHSVGTMQGNGAGAPQDKKKAMEYYLKSAQAGYWPARVSVAALIMEGEAVRRDDAKALQWLKPAAERAPDQFNTNERMIIANAQNLMGAIYYHGANNVPKNHDNAFSWFEKSAHGGNLDGQRNYGQMLRDRNRHAEAVTWLREAATKGDRAAQNDLGMMYLNGLGVAKSEQDAIAWLLRAYQQGSPTAKNTLRTLGVDAK